MKAIVFSDGAIQKKEIAQGRLPDGWIRIEVTKVGLCGSDVAKLSDQHLPIGHTDVLGHEFVGRVVATSGTTDSVAEGDCVVCMPIIPCDRCSACLHGRQNLCTNGQAIGRTHRGAFATHVDVPMRNAIRIPAVHAADSYVLTDPLAVCLHAINIGATSEAARNCLVIGDGTIGCLLAFLLRRRGNNVFLKGKHSENLGFAESFSITPLTEIPAREFDVVYETVGRKQVVTMNECMRATRRGGEIVVLGVFPPDYCYPLEMRELFIREIRLQGSNAYVPAEFSEAVLTVSHNMEAMDRFISHRFPLDRFQDALMVAKMKNGFTMKIILEPGEIANEGRV